MILSKVWAIAAELPGEGVGVGGREISHSRDGDSH